MEYEGKDIERRTGISRRKVQFLVDNLVIVPLERGRGKPIKYSERNLTEVAMTQVLQEQNLDVMSIYSIFDHLRKCNNKGEYMDFFTNDEWGRTKDLVYVTARVSGEPMTRIALARATEDVAMDYVLSEETMEHVVRPAIGPITIVPLGKIKNLALERLKTQT